ncbi:MAG: DUF1302 family protein [Desulfomonilia bacterium]
MRFIGAVLIALLWIGLTSLKTEAFQYEGDKGKLSLTGYLEGKAVYAFDGDTPEENPSVELGLELKASSASWLSTKIFLQAVDDGKVINPKNKALFNQFDRIYQDKNPYVNINEAYLDIYTGKVDFRLGVQKFAWGRLDEINPTDNLNTMDLTEGGTNDEIERKIGVPSLKINMYSDLANVELGWVPVYVPYRLPQPDERWFPKVLKPPEIIKTDTLVGDIPVNTIYQDIDLPPDTVGNSEMGVRVSKYIGGWDISCSYFTGYDTLPLMDAPVDLTVKLLNPLALDYQINAQVTMVPEIHRMDVFGFDFTTTMSSFTIRGEYAYFKNKYYNQKLDPVLEQLVTKARQDEIYKDFIVKYLASGGRDNVQVYHIDPHIPIQEDSMKYGLGLDYIHGDTSVSIQCIQEFIPNYDEDKPVYFNKNGVDTMLTFLFKQFFLQNTMEFNMRAAYDIEFQDVIIKPSLKYNFTDNLQGTIGVLFISSKYNDSLLGQFDDNDEIFAKLRCAF